MTDLEKFMELYGSIGITPEVNPKGYNLNDGSKTLLLIREGNPSPLIDGYGGFYTTIDFDSEGKFIKQGFWE